MKKLALATLIAVAFSTPVAAQQSIVILTGSTSGVYYPLGNAISAIFLKTIPAHGQAFRSPKALSRI